jgi:NADPH2:quinone reductase
LIVIGTVGRRSKIAAAERARLTTELLGQVESGRIKLAVNQRHPLAEASRAHSELQARKTEGSSVLVP